MLLAVAVPSARVPPSDTVTVEPSGAVPVKVTDSLEFATPVLMTGGGGRRRHRHIERAGRGAGPRRSRIGRGEGVGAGRQVRRGEAPGAGAARGRGAERAVPPSDTVTVEPSGAVPVKVTDSLEFATPVLMTGAAGGVVDDVPFAVSEILSRSHWLGPFAAENSSVDVLPVAVTV